MSRNVAWSIQPSSKKSIIERSEWYKDDNRFSCETIWWGGEFTAYTEDETPPKIESDTDLYSYDYDIDLVEMSSGDEFHDMDGCDEETVEWLEQFLDEHCVYELEDHGWHEGDAETVIISEVLIERAESLDIDKR